MDLVLGEFRSTISNPNSSFLTPGRNIAPIDRIGFKGLCLMDGPLAVRQAIHVSAFPAGLTTAASWDRNLINTRGQYLGAEFRGKGAQVYLGPVAGPLGRAAMNGRNWEGFSPDPYLTGVAMEETIIGVQSQGVQASAKHFIGYEQETQRNPAWTFDGGNTNPDANASDPESVSSNIEDRTIHELYMWPFANSIRAGVANVMCSYNRLNTSYACQNSKSLNGLLKTELGFQGFVVSDWGGTHAGVASANSGLDMTMPGPWSYVPITNTTPSWFGGNLTNAVNNGSVATARLDDMVRRVMTPYFQLGQDQDYPLVDPSSGVYPVVNSYEPESYWLDQWTASGSLGPNGVNVRGNHSALIRTLGAAGSVLLKNVNAALPLKSPQLVGVFGNAAGDAASGAFYADENYEYGCLPYGGGSGGGRFARLIAPLEALKTRVYADGGEVQYILNNTQLINPGADYEIGYAGVISPQPEVCLVFLKTYSAEGTDRTTLASDWNGDALVEAIASQCNNTVVITQSTGINIMPWADHENVTAILASHLSGEEIGNSLVDILYGDYNPSGHLPYTIAYNQSDYDFAPVTSSVDDPTDLNAWQANFTERLLIDYRHFDYYNLSVQYEFGYGLSYTTFNMSSISIAPLFNSTPTSLPAGSSLNVTAPGGNADLWTALYKVSVTVSNTGAVAGATVPQLYVTLPSTAGEGTPVKQLRGFEKVQLAVNGSSVVEFELMRRDISFWNVTLQEWEIPSGNFGVKVGFSSRDLPLELAFTL